jgi:predicted RNase H-like HicB family nuclease
MARLTYTVLLLPDTDLGGFTVEVPALPGVVAEMDTRDEAIANAIEAIHLMLEDLESDGTSPPVELQHPEVVRVEVCREATLELSRVARS